MRARLVIFLTLTVLLLAGCTGPSDPQSAGDDSPSSGGDGSGSGFKLQPGDHWVQRVYYEDTPDETVANIEYYVDGREAIHGTGTLRILSSDGQHAMWVRSGDGALVRETIAGAVKTYDYPCIGFAAAPEAPWTQEHSCHRFGTRNIMTSADSDKPLTTKTNGTQNTTVPAGSFDTLQLETLQDGETLGREFHAARACFPARVVTVDEGRTIILDLVTFKCTAATN